MRWNTKTGSYVKYTSDHGLVSTVVRAVAMAPDGALWFGTRDNGVSRFDGKTWRGCNPI